MRCPARGGFSLLEALFSVVLMLVVLGGALAFFQVGTNTVVTTSDHAQAREEALLVLEQIGKDLDRLVIGDDYSRTAFPNVVEPVLIEDQPKASKFLFYAFHHREFDRSTGRMQLVGKLLSYKVEERADGGVDLLRNDEPLNRYPLADVRFRRLDPDEAGRLGISPYHAIEVVIHPRGIWNTRNAALETFNPQTRLFHLDGVESQYACLLSLKRSGAPYPILALLPDPPPRSQVYLQYDLDKVPMDWIRPLGVVRLEDDFFDDSTAGHHQELP